MPDVHDDDPPADPIDRTEETALPPRADGPVPAGGPPPAGVRTAYADGIGSSANPDGTHHVAAPPGEGEGTGIGESGG